MLTLSNPLNNFDSSRNYTHTTTYLAFNDLCSPAHAEVGWPGQK